MKNTFKLIGIITFVALIAFSMAACDDGSTGGSSDGGGGSSGSGSFIVDRALIGTWKGVGSGDGTLIISASSFDAENNGMSTAAEAIAFGIQMAAMSAQLVRLDSNNKGTLSITNNEMRIKITEGGTVTQDDVLYTYSISGKTLTISHTNGSKQFEGTKQ